MHNLSFQDSVALWLKKHSIGRKPSTIHFNGEIARTALRYWPAPLKGCSEVSAVDLLAFGQAVAHYCPARWNALVSLARFVCPAHGHLLEFRAVQMRQFNPPGQTEFAGFLVECDRDSRSTAGLVVRFLCLTGLRIGEARALLWADVSADGVRVATSKNGRARTVPLLPGLAGVLARLRALGAGEFVLPRPSARKAIKSAARRAGLRVMTFHCCRHYFATRCIESGVDVPTVARWLGHGDGGALLARTYFHLLDDHSRAMAARVQIAA